MRTHEEGTAEMDPAVEADLTTIDRALGGMPPEPGSPDAELADLALLLRDERPQADPAWGTGLDERAAAGFPRGGSDGPGGGRSSWWRAGGWMAPAGALATLLVVLVVAVTSFWPEPTVNGTGEEVSGDAGLTGLSAPTTTTPSAAAESGDALDAAGIEPSMRLRDFKRSNDAGKIAPGTSNRKVQRDTQLSLSAQPDEVRNVTDEVISITRSLDGIVASSQVSETNGGATATLELTLPTRNIDAALDRMTELADVDSLTETTDDITRPYVSAQDRLDDAEALRRELLEALGNASTEAEVQALEIRLAAAREEISRAEAEFDAIARKARLSDLSVTVSSNPNASDERTLGDWFDDAVDVLRGVAGVLLVSAAILIPLALLAGIAWWIASRIRNRSRDNALN